MRKLQSVKRTTIVVFFVAFLLSTILFISLDYIFLIESRIRLKSIFASQIIILKSVSNYHRNSPTQDFPELRLMHITGKEHYLKDTRNFYYPDSWDKPGHILLKRKYGNFYCLTFGDGSRAVVTHWSLQGADQNDYPSNIHTTGAEKWNYSSFWGIPFVALIIALTLLLENKLQRRPYSRTENV